MIPTGFRRETTSPSRTGTAIRSNPVTELARWSNKPTLHSLCIVPTVLPLAGDHDAQNKPLKDIGVVKAARAQMLSLAFYALEATMPKTCHRETAFAAEINCSQNRD
jgi:hypothetical protein